jgi:outer membrane protein assembly factor BamB
MDILDSKEQYFIDDLVLWRHSLEGVKHTIEPPHTLRPNPLVVGDMVIASVFSPGSIHAVDRATGEGRWMLSTDGLASSSVTYAEGTLYGMSSYTLYAIDPLSGQVRWTFCPYGRDHEWIYSSPTISDGRLFLGDRAGYLNCLDATSGKVLWRRQTSRSQKRRVHSTAVVFGDLVIVATTVNSVVAYETTTGRPVWRSRLDSYSSYELLSWKDGVLVQTIESLYLLHPKSGEVLHRWHWSDKKVEAAVVAGDVLLIITEQRDASNANIHGSAQDNVEIKCLRGDEVIFEGLTSESVRGVRRSQETSLFYILGYDGLFILEAGAGGRIQEIRNKQGLLYPGLPDVKDGVIYMLGRDKTLYALRHP